MNISVSQRLKVLIDAKVFILDKMMGDYLLFMG